MKKLMLSLLAIASVTLLTACPDKGGGGKNHVTTPTSCNNYVYNQQYGYFMDRTGKRVNCDQGPYFGQGNYYTPYQNYTGGQYQNGCSIYNTWGTTYVPMQTQTYGVVCVSTASFYQIPNFNTYYSHYGSFPSYAMSCQYGVNCPSNCIGGAGVSAGVNLGPIWIGGTLAACF